LGVALLIGIGGCGSDQPKVETLPAATVERGVRAAVIRQLGAEPTEISCEQLEKRVGAATVCAVSDSNGNSGSLSVTITALDGDAASYDIVVIGQDQD